MNVPNVMIPTPPIWTSTISTDCPNVVKAGTGSIVESPVTQTAEHEVKSASMNPSPPDTGREKNPAPARMTPMKPNGMAYLAFIRQCPDQSLMPSRSLAHTPHMHNS